MFAIGEQLYRLTTRDEETLLVDPFVRAAAGVVIPAGTQADCSIFLPKDRMFFLHTVDVTLAISALTTYATDDITVSLLDAAGVATVFSRPMQAVTAAAGVGYSRIDRVQLILPPGTGSVRLNVIRSGTTNAANFNLRLVGYLLPPGRFGRS
jgi:hypothetical protein